MTRFILVLLLTVIIHFVLTIGYAARLAGVRTKSLAMAFSLYNVIFLVAQTATTLQAPLLAKMVEGAIHASAGASAYHEHIAALAWNIRWVIVASSVGSLIGVVFIPSFVRIFIKGIYAFEKLGSIPKIILLTLNPRKTQALLKTVRLPDTALVKETISVEGLSKINMPKAFLIFNILIVGLQTIGVLSSLYAGALLPEYRTTASSLSGIINGIGTVLTVIAVDPKSSLMTDQALRGERREHDVKVMIMLLAFGRVAGTILAQAFFVPAAYLIAWTTRII